MHQSKAYEVDMEFFEMFINSDQNNKQFFDFNFDTDKYHFNLPKFSLNQMQKANISSVEFTGHCTYMDEKSFFHIEEVVTKKSQITEDLYPQ